MWDDNAGVKSDTRLFLINFNVETNTFVSSLVVGDFINVYIFSLVQEPSDKVNWLLVIYNSTDFAPHHGEAIIEQYDTTTNSIMWTVKLVCNSTEQCGNIVP